MTTATKKTYYEALQDYADEYLAETGRLAATTRQFAAWAIQTGRWEPPANLLMKKCQEDFANALREQYIKDDRGRPVRAKHVARVVKHGEQQFFWADIRNAPRKHIESSFRLRRQQIVGDCRQLNRDREYWNKMHPEEKPIQLCFDFNDDVEEGEFSEDYPPKNPR